MRLSKIHQQDIREVNRIVGGNEEIALTLGESYGYAIAYRYLDTFMKPKEALQETFIQKTYKLFNQYIKQLKTN